MLTKKEKCVCYISNEFISEDLLFIWLIMLNYGIFGLKHFFVRVEWKKKYVYNIYINWFAIKLIGYNLELLYYKIEKQITQEFRF